MPRKVSNTLTSVTVRHAAPGRHVDGGGLHLLVKPGGARSWVFRFTLNGKARDVGLSKCQEAIAILQKRGGSELTLAEARQVAAIFRLKVKAGIDPLEERDRARAERAAAAAARLNAASFRNVAEAHIRAHSDTWRNPKHRAQWRSTLEAYVYPVFGDLPVSEVETRHVLQVIEPIWKSRTETASRVRGRIETILDAAKARGYRDGENPARWRGHIAQILPKRTHLSRGHHKAMDYGEVPDFLNQLRGRKAVAALALEFTILTVARSGEVLGATWKEMDLDKGVWTIPAERMKAGREHRVPLSARALAILGEVKMFGSDWVFPSRRGGRLSDMAMAMLLRRMNVEVTVHGFRSCFRDWAAERTSYAHEVCEMALAHTITNKVEAAYRRGDLFEKRRRLMGDWATYCTGEGAQEGTVTPIRSAS
jgi:integrase